MASRKPYSFLVTELYCRSIQNRLRNLPQSYSMLALEMICPGLQSRHLYPHLRSLLFPSMYLRVLQFRFSQMLTSILPVF